MKNIMDITSKLESILFVASKPLSLKALAKSLGAESVEVEAVLSELAIKYNQTESGINIFQEGGMVQMGTNPDNALVIKDFIKDEAGGELTKAQLETLTVIAYRGPITRPELEEIRGVNCSIIIRNLLIKGLVDEGEANNQLMETYTISFNALAHLGITSVEHLPAYQALRIHEHFQNNQSEV